MEKKIRNLKKYWLMWTDPKGQKRATECWAQNAKEAESGILKRCNPKAIPYENRNKLLKSENS